ncbi:Protein phosphatase 2C 6 [Thecaphora frezii]
MRASATASTSRVSLALAFSSPSTSAPRLSAARRTATRRAATAPFTNAASAPCAAPAFPLSTSTRPLVHHHSVGAPLPTSAPPCRLHSRCYHDYIRTLSPSRSSGRISLKASRTGVYGLATSRGTRAYQEDTTSVSCVSLPPSVLRASYLASSSAPLRQLAAEWSPSAGLEEKVASQLAWFGCFDGHGGKLISQFLSSELHCIFEEVQEDMVTDTVQYMRSLGGYFRRFNGGIIERWVRTEELKPVRAGGASGAARAAERTREAKGDEAERTRRQEKQRQEEERRPKTFAELVNSAKADAIAVGGRGGTVSATQASFSQADAAVRDVPTSQSSLIHSADQSVQLPAAGPVEHAQKPEPAVAAQGLQAGSASGSTSASPASTSFPSTSSLSASSSPGSAPIPEGTPRTSVVRRIPPPSSLSGSSMTISERLTLAWLHADRLIHTNPSLDVGGSTASVILLHSLDTPSQPFYSSSSLFLTTAHIGDTRVLLASVSDGQAIPLTNYHHPDDRSESERLRRMGAGMITDSFGEARWMGALANTRSFGDSRFKKVGVTSEPEIISQLIRGEDYAFVVAFSDGVGGVMSDQEIVDLCRGHRHPQEAADAVLRFAEELGTQDNGTVMVVPLKAWGKMKGEDTTKSRREFRRSKVDLYRDNRK